MRAILKKRESRLAIMIIIFVILLLAGILLPKPDVAWNSGARQTLAEALQDIGDKLGELNPRDFVCQKAVDDSGLYVVDGNELARKHGVELRWHDKNAYRNLHFYPIAISNKIDVTSDVNARVTPQLVMVPIDGVDRETLPILYGCEKAQGCEECQQKRIRELFHKYRLQYAAVLMSNNTVRFAPIDTLTSRQKSSELGRTKVSGMIFDER